MTNYLEATDERIKRNFNVDNEVKAMRAERIAELGEVRVTVGRNKGRRLKELSCKDLEWLATRSFDVDLKRAATDYLALMY